MSKNIKKFLEDCVKGLVSVDAQVEFLENFTPEKVTAEDVKMFAKFMLKNIMPHLLILVMKKMHSCITMT